MPRAIDGDTASPALLERALSDSLGRPVCGYLLDDGTPCPAAPGPRGRCAEHEEAGVNRASSASMRRRTAAGRTIFMTASTLIFCLAVVGGILYLRQDPAESIWREAATLMAAGRPMEARSLYTLIVRDHAASRYAEESRRLIGIGVAGSPLATAPVTSSIETPAGKLYNEARSFYPLGGQTSSDLEGAARRYLAVADSWPEDPLAARSVFEAAQCFDRLERTDDAMRTYERFIKNYPDSDRAAEALYALGFIHYTQRGDRHAAEQCFAELLRRYPDSNAAEAARVMLGEAPVEAPPTPRSPSGRPSVHTTPGGL